MTLGRPSSDDDQLLREAVVAALEELAHGTGKAIAVLRRRARINRRLIWGLIGVALAQLLMFVAAVVIGMNVAHNSDKIDHIQQRTNNEVLCPLYSLFHDAKKFPPPNSYSEEQKKIRMEWFDEIDRGAIKLGCVKE